MALCRHGVEWRIVALREERKLVLQPHVHVDAQTRAIFECAHDMRGAAFRTLEPADITAVAAATQHTQPRGQGAIPSEVHVAGAHAFNIRDHGHHEECNVGTRDGEVVQHAGIRHFHPGFPGFLTLGIEGITGHIAAAEALRFVGNAQHFASIGIELRVCGKRLGGQLPAETVDRVERLQGMGIHNHRRTVFLQHHQFAVVMEDVRVGRAAA